MQLRVRSWAGWRDRDPTATLLGNVVVPSTQDHPPFWRTNRPWNKIFFSSFHLEPRHLPAYVRKLRSLGRVWFEAYPSTAFVLAQHLAETRDTLPLAGVFLSSETLTRSARALIEERFDTRVWDSYSLSERVLFAGECEAHDGQHLCPEFGIVEILDENDQPVPPGQPGRVVATGLQNFAMPLIRYDTGDVGGLDPRPCPCGRTLPRMPPITTKAEDVVRTPEGRLISASVLTHPFKPLHSIGSSQILQDAPDHVLVRIVPRPTYGPEDERALRAGLRQRLGPSMRIDVETVDDIPRTRAGKYRWVVSRVPLGFGPAAATNLFWSEDDPS
jgi:phenylacetate-CoA ligase